MRLKKGSIIEVLSKNELPSGSWRCAEVVCVNGQTYTVEYKLDTYVSNVLKVESVSRKYIRPCPPSVELAENFAPGDVLEVFQNFSWKMATVCKALINNDFLVRLVGFSNEFKVSRSDLRVRQSWQDEKWFVIGKNIGQWEEGNNNERSIKKHNQQKSSQVTRVERKMNPNAIGDIYSASNKRVVPIIALKSRKREFSYAHSEVEVPAKKARKLKVINKEIIRYRLPEKVVTKAGGKPLYTALKAVGHACEIRLEKPNEEDITCSVGSCSVTSNDLFKSCSYFLEGPFDAECSDAESVFCGFSNEGNNLPTQKECEEEIRRLELHAYRCTMEALYSCGPLSWEQETMVTNLRLILNISNDEHLMELRHLISTATSLAFR